MPKRTRKTRDVPLSREALHHVARRFRLLGDPTRLQLLQELMQGEATVGDLVERVGTSQTNASKQLTALAREGILRRRREGAYVFYSLADPNLRKLCELVCGSLALRFEEAHDHVR